MMWRFLVRAGVVVATLFCSISAGWSAPKEVKTLEIGAAAPDFELPGIDGKTYRLKDFADARVLVIVFTCNHCPTAQAYEDRLLRLHADYKARGVALVAVSPNDPRAVRLDELGYSDLGDSLDDMKVRAKDKGFAFPYLYDGDRQETSAAYGVLATPHVFIFDAQRKLRYVGRVDDSEVGTVQSHDARNAIEALLAGRSVPVETTRVFGCSTKWSAKRKSAAEALKQWDAEAVSLDVIDQAGVKKSAANETKNLRLINVWATWCIPCVEELAELVTIHRMYRNRRFEMITISLDGAKNRERALEFLTKQHVSAKNYVFGSASYDELAESLDPKWPGPVPYTLLIAPGGKIIYRKHDAFDPLEVKKAIVEHLGRTYANR
ncbi:MAG: redoxin domain-containing protein [Pirellulales bacterium]|nr:redoxin domain-containing protein [Pirellulales bacterium]